MSQEIEVKKEFRFCASHVLPRHNGQCARCHGHEWVLTIGVKGPVDPETGFVIDYADLKEIVNEAIVDKLDHQHLGPHALADEEHVRDTAILGEKGYPYQVPSILGKGFYPSSENLVLRFVEILSKAFNPVKAFRLSYVSLKETCTSEAIWQV